jgi:hypothetical protein|tara:strand:+ start:28021 stop:28287 length:267 start_codon:yes stop_codon:yes gene_type:complete
MGISRKLKKTAKKEIKNSSKSRPFKKKKITWSVEVGDLVEFVNMSEPSFAIVADKRVANNVTSLLVSDPKHGDLLWINAKKVRRIVDK